MRIKKITGFRNILLLLLHLFNCCALRAQTETHLPFGNDAYVENWLKKNKVPALGIGVINKGKLQQVKVYGELSSGVTAPYNTIWNVASLTKPVTAMVALKLVSAGNWSLDEPVSILDGP
jgi:CubicO group peptidase (beta-lactamase class C family)